MANLEVDDVFGGDETVLSKLVQELDAMYPLRNPSPKDDDRVIMYRAGQRAVVEYIIAKQTNNV